MFMSCYISMCTIHITTCIKGHLKGCKKSIYPNKKHCIGAYCSKQLSHVTAQNTLN